MAAALMCLHWLVLWVSVPDFRRFFSFNFSLVPQWHSPEKNTNFDAYQNHKINLRIFSDSIYLFFLGRLCVIAVMNIQPVDLNPYSVRDTLRRPLNHRKQK